MPVSFFTKTTATNVWKSVTSVSAAGSKRGRGKGTGRIIAKDFNKGQNIGIGRRNLVLPGLNARVNAGSKLIEIQDAGMNQNYDQMLKEGRADLAYGRGYRIPENPIDRGWSGSKLRGRWAGKPDDHNETSFDGFTSRVLMSNSRLIMTSNLGRSRRFDSLVVTGNENGLGGFATAVGNDARSVIRLARNRAGQALVQIPRWDNHTVMHDFFSRYYFTTVFVQRKPKGHGVIAHRAIKAICEVLGIKDLYAKCEGNTANLVNVTKAFFLGLMNQKKYEDIAEEKRLHLVELREENFNYPMVLASPKSPVRHEDEIKNTDENLDFTYFINDGKIKQVKAPPRNPFVGDDSWYKHLRKLDYNKNREKTKLLLAAKYGDTRVKDVFPYFRCNAESFNKGTGVIEN